MSKLLHKETYCEYEITINGQYQSGIHSLMYGETDCVWLDYDITRIGREFLIKSDIIYQFKRVDREQPYRILFWKVEPKVSFKEKVERELKELIQEIKHELDSIENDKAITKRLLNSLEEF